MVRHTYHTYTCMCICVRRLSQYRCLRRAAPDGWGLQLGLGPLRPSCQSLVALTDSLCHPRPGRALISAAPSTQPLFTTSPDKPCNLATRINASPLCYKQKPCPPQQRHVTRSQSHGNPYRRHFKLLLCRKTESRNRTSAAQQKEPFAARLFHPASGPDLGTSKEVEAQQCTKIAGNK